MNLESLERLNLSGSRLAEPVPPLWRLPALTELVLHDAMLPGIPAEVLSQGPYESCLESLRAHFADLEAGQDVVSDIKS
jgi:internalin A